MRDLRSGDEERIVAALLRCAPHILANAIDLDRGYTVKRKEPVRDAIDEARHAAWLEGRGPLARNSVKWRKVGGRARKVWRNKPGAGRPRADGAPVARAGVAKPKAKRKRRRRKAKGVAPSTEQR